MDRHTRALRHAALGDERRLLIVDQLTSGDLTVSELAELVDMGSNLVAHHLEVLDEAGLIDRRISEGDHRRRYVSLRQDALPVAPLPTSSLPGGVCFVCTKNSARSQFAAALWEKVTGTHAFSAGTDPAETVHPLAVEVAGELGVDISEAVPSGYDALPGTPKLVVSVCDRARETDVPTAQRTLHWSIPDPVPSSSRGAFRTAFGEIARRISRLAGVPL